MITGQKQRPKSPWSSRRSACNFGILAANCLSGQIDRLRASRIAENVSTRASHPKIITSVFGAEFVAQKLGIERCRGLRYKLRMMGVPISGPNYVFCDNMSVVHNTQRPESTLKKKSECDLLSL
jgi:hypothetical protein